MPRKIISVTGTKGKTTIVRLLDHVYTQLGFETLRVDNDGYYLSGRLKGNAPFSKNIFGLFPSVCPGKFLLAIKNNPNAIAILETSIGSGGSAGLGYHSHYIGILSNVFEDHITGKKIKTRKDILKAKLFIVQNIALDGFAVLNIDNDLVPLAIGHIPPSATLIPYGINCKYYDLQKHLAMGGVAITQENNYIVLKKKSSTEKILNLNKIEFAFHGQYSPSVYNIMAVCAAVYADHHLTFPRNFAHIVYNYKLDVRGGRLVTINKKGRIIIVDFAHEKYSLKELIALGKKLGKRCLVVLRFAPGKTNKIIKEAGEFIAKDADKFYVWDKIDGRRRLEHIRASHGIHRKPGDVSKILTESIKGRGGNAIDLLFEEKAIETAILESKKWDCVIIISGDDKPYTLKKVYQALSRLSKHHDQS